MNSGSTKVCIIRHAYFPDDPTIRKEAYSILEAGNTVDVLCLRRKGQKARENVKGAKVYRIPVSHNRGSIVHYSAEYFFSFIFMSIAALMLFIRNNYECIQVNTMPDFLVFSTIIPKILGAKVILHLHEPTPELWITKYGSNHLRWLLFLQTKIEGLAIQYADQCLTVTEALRRRLGERGANIDKITVIPNVCDEDTFRANQSSQVSVSGSKFRIVTHGLIEKRYGHELIIRAVDQLKKRLPNLQFEIIGEGEYRSKLARIVKKLKCENRVHFLGFIPVKELLQKLRFADVGIVAMEKSPYSELVDTTKMYEYIALRKPIIASRLPALEDNFNDSCIMYFDPSNQEDLARCIFKLYHSPARRHELVENAYKKYEEMRWNRTKERYLRTIQDLIGNK